MSTSSSSAAAVVVCSTKDEVARQLCAAVLERGAAAVAKRGAFTVALSGGSLAAFLARMAEAAEAGTTNAAAPLSHEPRFDKWHVLLADERCVALDDEDSNLGALTEQFLSKVPIPNDQIYGIDQALVVSSGGSSGSDGGGEGTASSSTTTTTISEAIAVDYERKVRSALSKSGDCLDLAVLGFGPDGHTASLFPGHALLEERTKWVASIDDSPKPPPKRITLTLEVFNRRTRQVVFCGAGSSKSPILQKVVANLGTGSALGTTTASAAAARRHAMAVADPPPFPCAMVQPNPVNTDDDNDDDDGGNKNRCRVVWIVDEDAMEGVGKRHP